MATTEVRFFKEGDDAPVLSWLRELRGRNQRAYARCMAAVHRLGAVGHELRRPTADYLEDGIYELRVHEGRVQYRILYCFQGKYVALLVHAATKEDRVEISDLEIARRRMRAFESDPVRHLYKREGSAS